ncbi:hypothetical protein ACQZ6F_27385 [Rhizobium sp. A22-96]
MTSTKLIGFLLPLAVTLAGCGTATEKTAPCKRPANLTSFAEDVRSQCGPAQPVNDPIQAFAAIGILNRK